MRGTQGSAPSAAGAFAAGGDGEPLRLVILAVGGGTARASPAGALARRMEGVALGGMELIDLPGAGEGGADPYRTRSRIR